MSVMQNQVVWGNGGVWAQLTVEANQRRWVQWIQENWQALTQGVQLIAPEWFPHPSNSGFERPPLAEPVGQVDDWVLSFADGSRVHIHEHQSGALVAHRDQTDPKRGLFPAIWHWLSESKSGRVVGALSIGALVLAAFNAASEE